jgi:hypothetical protein
MPAFDPRNVHNSRRGLGPEVSSIHQIGHRLCKGFFGLYPLVLGRSAFTTIPVIGQDMWSYRSRTMSDECLGQACDLPLNFHPAGTGALWVDTPNGAGGATDRCAEFSGNAARLSVAVNRSSANAWGVW